MSRLYQIHQFAELAGVTVKALHHYDRLGLLKPGRTNAGYRRYSNRDLERLEQIIALKFLGFPLKQIRTLLGQSTPKLGESLRFQKRALALALQASLMVRFSPPAISDAFCATRLEGDWGRSFGTLPQNVDTAGIIQMLGMVESSK